MYATIKRITSSTLGMLVGSMICASTALGAGFSDSADISYQNPKWMSRLPDQVKVSQLSIPGTHDTMALHSKAGVDGPFVKTQSLSLNKQLHAGIRYLDIRVRCIGDSFAIHHGPVFQQAMFGDVLKTVTDFLSQNPEETVFMRVREEYEAEAGSQSFEEILTRYWNSNASYFWDPSSSNPTLGSVRGKIVILEDFSANRQFGINYHSLSIQDDFEVDSMTNKWNAVYRHILAANQDTNQIYLNHLSGTGKNWYNYLSGHTPKGIAETINPQVTSLLKYEGSNGSSIAADIIEALHGKAIQHSGIIAADFPDGELIDSVITLNNR